MMRKPKRWLALCAVVLLGTLLVSGCVPGSGDSARTESLSAPQPAAGAQRDSYDMRLTLDTDAKIIGGSVTVKLTNTSDDAWTRLCFRDYIAAIGETFDKMSGAGTGLESAFTGVSDTAAGETLAYSRTEADKSVLVVDLNAPLAPGAGMEVRFDYTAQIPQDAFRYRYTAVNGDAQDRREVPAILRAEHRRIPVRHARRCDDKRLDRRD